MSELATRDSWQLLLLSPTLNVLLPPPQHVVYHHPLGRISRYTHKGQPLGSLQITRVLFQISMQERLLELRTAAQ